ncbi:hypothetical protein PtrV1_06522 [Pyrenophora tritici-repentis]|nr:hypothetical protein PtrV1_06522 [Pyrenophora tritici-repentis]KAI0606745.1 hypothetical protein TUN205_09007 [Pyrenophora tritici-repentis]
MRSPTRIPFHYKSIKHAMPIENFDAGEKPMSQEKQHLLDEMEPLVKQVLDLCDESAIKKLVELNEKMIETNVKENLFPVEHCVPVRHLVGANRKRMCLMETVQNSLASIEDLKEAEAAGRELQTLQSKLRAYMTELMLPPSWTFKISDIDIHRPAERQQLSNANGHDVCSTEFPNTQSSNAMDITYDGTPGQTTRGEEILAFRSVTMTGTLISTGETQQIYSSIQFVIKSEGRNPIKIYNKGEVGSRAVEAYLGLSEDQKCNIAHVDNNYSRLDDLKFGKIIGVAHDPYATKAHSLPWTVVLIEYDGKPCVINRTALRNAKGKGIADGLINKFLISVGEEPDTPEEGAYLRQADNRLLLKRYDSGRRFGNRSTGFQTGSPLMLPDQEELYYDLDTPIPRDERHQAGAAAGGETVTKEQFDALMKMVQQLAVDVQRN